MKISSQILSVIMLAVMLFVAARFTVLRAVVKFQKKQFRYTALLQQRNELKQLEFKTEELYEDTKDIEWKEDNKELVFNGKYHEVVSVERKDGIYLVKIIEDSKENELFRSFFEQTDNKGQLAECIILVMGMTFVVTAPFEFNEQPKVAVKHQTRFTLKSGIEICSCAEKPPQV